MPAFYEPTPYCDRLTLAEGFARDEETQANAEDRRPTCKPVESCIEVLDDLVAPRPRR